MEKQLSPIEHSRNVPQLRFPEFVEKWDESNLAKLAIINMGQSPDSSSYNKIGDGYYLIQGNADITNRKTNPRNWTNKPTKLCEIGDVILTVRAPVGAVAKSYHNACIGRGVCSIKNREKSHIEFLYQFLLGFEKKWYRLEQGSTFTAVSGKDIKSLLINFPSIIEQQKIASFLTDVDEAITQLTKKKSLLEQYKKGVMQKIFPSTGSGQVPELRFKDDEGNSFPDWEEKKLGNICNYKNGGSFEQYVSNEGTFNLISLNSIDIKGKLKQKHKKVTINDNSLNKGDLIMVLSDVAHGYFLGLTDIIPDNTFVLNQRMGALKPKININRYFLKTYINFNQKYFKLMGQGSSQQNLSKGDILKFIIKTPILEEQEKIANFLSDIDVKIEALTTKIENSNTFKKGLLQQMFV